MSASRIFYDREEALENEFFHRNAVTFRLLSQRTRIFAMQLASDMGMSDVVCEQYATDLVGVFAECFDDEALIDRVLCDLHDIGIAEHRLVIERRLREAELVADGDFF